MSLDRSSSTVYNCELTLRHYSGAVICTYIRIICSTPLIRLGKLSEETGCTIAVKAEFMNPGGSVKDRAALYLVKDAEEKGT